ncbi:MAG TPA: DinB family protein [Acidimicrobiales bacterium]|nr:DinB family protein [Acidimicrobiales bacterium]
MPIAPDTKDWTWVLERPCGECGFDPALCQRSLTAQAIRENAAAWALILKRDDVRVRPREDRWSDLEYACHVRDVYRIFEQRLGSMLAEDNPTFENWDQDATAVRDRYDLQDPALVSRELLVAAMNYANRFDSVSDLEWCRPGTRSNGSHFTVETLAIYGLHDPFHHLWDVTSSR